MKHEKPLHKPRAKNVSKLLSHGVVGQFSKPLGAFFDGQMADLTDPEKLTIVYIGHATTYINFFGTRILTDPVFSKSLGGIIHRHVRPGLTLDQIPPLDLVIVSHPHMDHFDRPTLKRLAPKTSNLLIPRNSHDLVKRMLFPTVFEADWGQTHHFNDLKIFTFEPKHWGKRFPWERKNRGYNSYILQKNGTNILFAGDSGYTTAFAQNSQAYPIDIAFLPITAYNPEEFQRYHMNPQDAVKVFREIKAKHLIPIHWGTFRLSLEPMDEPPRLLKESMKAMGAENQLQLLYPGQMFEYQKK